MALYYPSDKTFPSISVTGGSCELGCLHCGGRYLGRMRDGSAGRLGGLCRLAAEQGAKGALISGGCDARGAVPIPHSELATGSLPDGFLLNVHAGLPHSFGDGFTRASCVSMDVPPSDYTVRTVYGLKHAGRDSYVSALQTLVDEGVRVVPHICMGIDGKGEHGELETLELLEPIVDHVVLLSLKRTPGQPHTEKTPGADICEKIIKEARERFKCLGLGCMRDRAPAKERLWHYFDTIAWPSSIIKDELARSERTCTTYEICCAV